MKTTIAPMLTIHNGVTNIDFYKDAFGAKELRRFRNDDGSIHVAELEINGSPFNVHEQNEQYNACPEVLKATTVTIGLFVDNVEEVLAKALKAGATLISPPEDYFYGYRQADITDPFGHRWQIEKVI